MHRSKQRDRVEIRKKKKKSGSAKGASEERPATNTGS
jgi:hypothetical protein